MKLLIFKRLLIFLLFIIFDYRAAKAECPQLCKCDNRKSKQTITDETQSLKFYIKAKCNSSEDLDLQKIYFGNEVTDVISL